MIMFIGVLITRNTTVVAASIYDLGYMVVLAGDAIGEMNGTHMTSSSVFHQTNKNLQISEALAIQMQIEVQRRLHEQIEYEGNTYNQLLKKHRDHWKPKLRHSWTRVYKSLTIRIGLKSIYSEHKCLVRREKHGVIRAQIFGVGKTSLTEKLALYLKGTLFGLKKQQ
ncbi:unnamed protein product [Lactuca virosa]|uniref:H(+)-exporting diphosphatase n=1 Tax=Lactuca virosa TaxID=75947 RepID=A0AAU9LGZ5_9ASTR|nr:unnamed protein product [Lactuca virosa]